MTSRIGKNIDSVFFTLFFTCRLQLDILRLLGKYKQWGSIPKFFNMRKYAQDIRTYGSTDLTTTGPKESYVKTVRAAWLVTNKRPENLHQQVTMFENKY